MIDILLSFILWTTIEITDPEIELNVTCDRVELDINTTPGVAPVIVKFYVHDPKFDYIWSYRVPMRKEKGKILLEPAAYWVEEIKQSRALNLEIEGKQYTFNLKGSKKALKECNGVVAE